MVDDVCPVFAGDFGRSFDWDMPVADLLWNRLGLTFVLSFTALIFTWLIAFPVGIYSAVRKYSVGDYFATFMAFIGLAVPNFLFALVLMYIALRFWGISIDGLYSARFADAPWSWEKFLDLAQHLVIPVIVLSGGNQPEDQLAAHRLMAEASDRGLHVVASRSAHWIQFDEPGLIVDAIREIIALQAFGEVNHTR